MDNPRDYEHRAACCNRRAWVSSPTRTPDPVDRTSERTRHEVLPIALGLALQEWPEDKKRLLDDGMYYANRG